MLHFLTYSNFIPHLISTSLKVTASLILSLPFRWLHEIEQNCDVVNRVLVGNKNDDPSRKIVDSADARRFADQMGIKLFETSAKENINVEEMFRSITDQVLRSKRDQKEKNDQQPDSIRVGGNRRPGQKPNKKGGCCK